MPSRETSLPELVLKRREERRIRRGHPWVYSNEVDTARTPLRELVAGELVTVREAGGRAVGTAYVNPSSLICARLLSRRPDMRVDVDFLAERIRKALDLREHIFERPYYRMVFGEADGLPGVVVDRYGDVLVLQIGTAGMERLRGTLLDALDAVLPTRVVILRNDSSARSLEGLDSYVETVKGEPPSEVFLEENGARFHCSPLRGQKTGWFYDHRMNRRRCAHYARDARMLDVFSYAGAWGIQAAVRGAREVLCVDASAQALEQARENAKMNGVEARVSTRRGDAFQVLHQLAADGESFDLVVLDPPAFAKRRRDLPVAMAAYRRVNESALRLLGDEGYLITASCSYHVDARELLRAVGMSAARLGLHLQLLEQGGQSPDHPVHPAIPETAYLKCLVLRAYR